MNGLQLLLFLGLDLPPFLEQKTQSFPHFRVNRLRVFTKPALDAVRYLIGSDFVVDLLNADLSGSHVSALHTEKQSNEVNPV